MKFKFLCTLYLLSNFFIVSLKSIQGSDVRALEHSQTLGADVEGGLTQEEKDPFCTTCLNTFDEFVEDNKPFSMVQLPCHESHKVCTDCFVMQYQQMSGQNGMSCGVCRAPYNLSGKLKGDVDLASRNVDLASRNVDLASRNVVLERASVRLVNINDELVKEFEKERKEKGNRISELIVEGHVNRCEGLYYGTLSSSLFCFPGAAFLTFGIMKILNSSSIVGGAAIIVGSSLLVFNRIVVKDFEKAVDRGRQDLDILRREIDAQNEE